MIYVKLKKGTNEVLGTVSVSPLVLNDWEKDYTMIPAGEDYRGKSKIEITSDAGKLRFATQQEIDAHKQSMEQATRVDKKEEALAALGLTQADLDKVKALGGV